MSLRFCFCIVWLILSTGCGSQSQVQPPSSVRQTVDDSPSHMRFVDRTETLGIDFVYQNGEAANKYTILESIGGGVAICDYDLNGLDDLLFPGGGLFSSENQLSGLPTALFSQVSSDQFVNQSLNSGIAAARYYSHGCSVADYDNDGFPDVVITGYGGILVWHNLGDGTFEEVSELSGLIDPSWSTSAGWGDLNGDGALDLYLTHYVDWSFKNDPLCGDAAKPQDVCPPRRFKGLDDRVFFSNGDGAFHDATKKAGLVSAGKGLGVVLGDLDEDLDLDIYVGNDTTDNFLYLNQGQGNFQEAALVRGVAVDDEAVANGSMGVDIGDYNGDGQPDLWVANYEADRFALYKNIGSGQFLYASRETGVGTIGKLFVGFGTKFGDYDSDGDEDIIVSNGHVIRYPKHTTVRQLPLLLENRGGRFQRLTFDEKSYLGMLHHGRGLATGDLDQDGDLDLVFANCNERATILDNQTETDSKSIQVRLVGTKSNRDGIGARIVFHTSQGDISRYVTGGGSYLSQNRYLVHCALPSDATMEAFTVYWPSGKRSVCDEPLANGPLYNYVE